MIVLSHLSVPGICLHQCNYLNLLLIPKKFCVRPVLFILGGMRYKGFLNSSMDLNDKQVGLYICNSASGGIPANVPDDMNTSFIYIGFGEGTTWGAQIIITTSSDTAMYFRSYVSSAIRNWKKVQIQ